MNNKDFDAFIKKHQAVEESLTNMPLVLKWPYMA